MNAAAALWLLVALTASPAYAEAVGFALTGSDDVKVRVIDRANCVFGINNENKQIFHLNNVQTDRILFQNWVRKHPSWEEKYVTIELHGDATVYEETTTVNEALYGTTGPSGELAKLLKEKDPNFFKPKHTSSK
jgi:hypothetical protein